MTTIYLLRHGQSKANLDAKFVGQTDSPLTELGERQAEKAGEFLNQFDIDMIFASPLKRAYDTAKPISRLKNIPIIPVKDLMEIYGGKWENSYFAEIKNISAEDYDTWMNDIGNSRCTDGEAVAELYDRITSAILKISRENEGKSICIATHATPIRVFECFVNGEDASYAKNVEWVPNASVTAFSFDGEKFEQIFRAENSYLEELATVLPSNI